ncbi:exodeoxyribonuclease VII large subunit [Spiribacter vilamensis]|uniref:Exodeoxyribonuclease 7 large subunit n=1 Tax=Spiribacter vilamensis TaxID=531306 RepID=A0A4Q8CYW1_9GAMM|nr:exodeoxyribonuclease VII large subunit [Spiribacter vilamensis]RZU98196.1 exodeoxyribonuclease VII large subunit [Spiribacter vilamensis]TVO60903.1 exodeoxyribonuclease VII large subunit [Spiribacter vilamensis]
MDTPTADNIYTVSRLNQTVRALLEQALPLVWVEGEISNLARPRSGHIYFTLKDADSQVRCALFHNRAMRLRTTPENGDQVRIRARIGLYAPRGEYQLIAEHLEPAGDGALQRAFAALKARLDAEGLFDPAGKQPIPTLPRRVGVITSPTGAAVRDIVSVLRRRFPALPILIYPVSAQGERAVGEIVDAIRTADRRQEVEALIVGRGGGSLEDLQAFNDEQVARAIHACTLPVISAVGHEVDITIADLVADERAATPSAAAERLSPDGEALSRALRQGRERLQQGLARKLGERREQINRLERRLSAQHPGRRLRDRAQRLDELDQRLGRAMTAHLQTRSRQVERLDRRVQAQNPTPGLQRLADSTARLNQRLERGLRERLNRERARLEASARTLESLSPLGTLARGYAIVQPVDSGAVIHRATDVAVGDPIRARLNEGILIARVEGHDETT